MLHEFRSHLKLAVLFFITTWLMLASVPSVAANRCLQALENHSVRKTLELPVSHLYVAGEARSESILFFSADDLKKALLTDSIPVNAILVLDELPLSEDFPLVSAIIIEKEMKIEATHVQALAEKMEIPIVVIKGATTHSGILNLARSQKSFRLNCESRRCQLTGEAQSYSPKMRIKSVLPTRADREEQILFSSLHPREFTPRELAGDKYFNLMAFKRKFPDLVPDIRALSAGYYEEFLNEFRFNEVSLRWMFYQMLMKIQKAEANNDEKSVRDLLAEFKHALLNSKNRRNDVNFFEKIGRELKSIYFNEDRPFSLRSNNDVEDLLAAGLYKSAFVQSLDAEELEAGFKKIWASMYDYRAYAIRRYWGQHEENLSMPVMVHPFVDRTLAHAVATFRRTKDRQHVLEVNMVLGSQEKATNPSAEAQSLRLMVHYNKSGKPEVKIDDPAQEVLLTKQLRGPLLKFFKETYPFIQWEFESRVYSPTSISMEFVVQDKKNFWNSRKIVVLQYKPNLNKEAVMALISGEAIREDMDKRIRHLPEKMATSEVLNQLYLYPLTEGTPSNLLNYRNGRSRELKKEQRYALLMEDGQPFFIFWDSGKYHLNVKEHLYKANVSWIKSGYIKMRTSENTTKLIFTETTLTEGVDRNLLLSISKKLFQSAFDLALKENSALRELIFKVRPTVEFQTFEGDGIISVDYPKAP